MSRIANKLIQIPKGVEVIINNQDARVKGPHGELTCQIHSSVSVSLEESEGDKVIKVHYKDERNQAGTTRALLQNMILGVSQGCSQKLVLVGVGYRASTTTKGQQKILVLNLGFSHPIDYVLPKDIKVDLPSPTEITISGNNKQLVGQVAAEIRSYRPPEPYNGKGVRYANEKVIIKEAKK